MQTKKVGTFFMNGEQKDRDLNRGPPDLGARLNYSASDHSANTAELTGIFLKNFFVYYQVQKESFVVLNPA
jgi:hypothetical protein